MSGKYTKNKAKKKKRVGLWIALALVLCLVPVLILMLPTQSGKETHEDQSPFPKETQVLYQNGEIEGTSQGSLITGLSIPVNKDLEIQAIGGYTGIYMEDGTDEPVSGVLMLKLVNNGENTIEYAKMTLNIDGETAEFTVTTLKPGAEVVLLEKNRMEYDKTVNYTEAEVVCENLAFFAAPPSLQEDKLTIQNLNGAINVTNVSGGDIPGKIAVYYKNKAAGIYYGGITYRIVLENGLKAGEVRQMMASHFSETGSEILFVTIAQ